MHLQNYVNNITTYFNALIPKEKYNELFVCIQKYVAYAVTNKKNLEFILQLTRNDLAIIIPDGSIDGRVTHGVDVYLTKIDMSFFHRFLSSGTGFEFPFEDKKVIIDFDMESDLPVSYTDMMNSKRSYRGMMRILYTMN